MSERQMTSVAAQALVERAEILSRTGIISADPRLPSARTIVTRLDAARKISLTERAPSIKQPNPHDHLYELSPYNPVNQQEFEDFCGTCSVFQPPTSCELPHIDYIIQRTLVRDGYCSYARVGGRYGRMIRKGFVPETT